MKQGMAITILITTVVLPALGWATVTLFSHESRISKNETIHSRLHRIEKKQDRILEVLNGD